MNATNQSAHVAPIQFPIFCRDITGCYCIFSKTELIKVLEFGSCVGIIHEDLKKQGFAKEYTRYMGGDMLEITREKFVAQYVDMKDNKIII